ncbi:unnamed protein product, partial [Prorocentrum cordatum]
EGGKKDAGLAEAKGWQDGKKQVVSLMLRQTMRSAQQIRELQSTLFDVFLAPEGSPIVWAMQEQTSMYSETVKNNKNHELGHRPDQQDQPIKISDARHQTIVKAHDEYAEYTLEKKCELARVCKLEKVSQKGKKKLTMCFRNQTFRATIMQACQGIGQMDLKQCRARTSFPERELQAVLE